MPDGGEMPQDVDFSTPNIARIYDYYLGGKDNYPADREAARRVLGVAPDVPLAALENREFLKRAVEFLVREQGISQFLDIGPGLPTQGNVHQLARRHDPGVHVAYVDNDPVVVEHSRSLLNGVPGVTVIGGDLREPETILADPALRDLIDFGRPVGLCMTLVLHFVPAGDDPSDVLARFRDALCPGSFLVLSHVTGDGREPGTLSEVGDVYVNANASLIMRTREQIAGFFNGFELVQPGVVFLSQWRPTGELYARGGTRWDIAAWGRSHGNRGISTASIYSPNAPGARSWSH
jgi:SAM-dependent methyltransferase